MTTFTHSTAFYRSRFAMSASSTRSRFLPFVGCLLLLGSAVTAGDERTISALWMGSGQLQIVDGMHPDAVVVGKFTDDIATTGWSYLSITDMRHAGNRASPSDDVVAHLAGWVELNLTVSLIEMQWHNTMGDYCSQKPDVCKAVDQFLANNQQFYSDNANVSDPKWYQLNLFEKQLDGMIDAYNEMDRNILPAHALKYFQLHGEIDDLESALDPQSHFSSSSKHTPHSPASSTKHIVGSGSCSAIIKLLPDNSDLLVGHNTWTSFANMLRVFKRYELYYQMSDIDSRIIPGHTITFSSYPGRLYSGDDFYLISSGLVTMETSIEVTNSSQWSYVNYGSILENRRVMIANRLSMTTLEWAKTFLFGNSGTYNNQWMILDYKLFTPYNSELRDYLLVVLEQIPSEIVYQDMTSSLRENSYWSSYNIPYFDDIFTLSGNDQLVKQYGDWFSWRGAPRAKIFARDHHKVVDMSSLTKLMKYNDFQHDELAQCNCTPPYSGENGIAARSDLNPADGTYPFPALGHRLHGAIDMKVTSSSMFKNSACIAYSGPTFQQQPPFQWSTSGSETIPLGHPDRWTFPDVTIQWNT